MKKNAGLLHEKNQFITVLILTKLIKYSIKFLFRFKHKRCSPNILTNSNGKAKNSQDNFEENRIS